MRSLALMSLLLLAGPAVARVALLETRTGQSLEGHVRIESNAVIVVNFERNLIVQIPVTNLLGLTFRSRPEPESQSTTAPGDSSGALPLPWRSEDIGSVRLAGSATAFAGFFTVRSSGTNVAGGEDAFQFVCKPARGRSDLVARVPFVQFTHPGAQAGLMMRENLGAGSPNVFVGLLPRRAGFFQSRNREGGATAREAVTNLPSPRWLRLKREGSQFAAYHSRDGRQWSLLHTAVVAMAEAMHVGLAVASGPAGQINTSTFDRVQEAPWLWTSPILPRVELRSGSVVSGLIRSMDDTGVYFLGAPPREPIATRAVSRIFFEWLNPREIAKLQAGKPGVLLRQGEFIEGELRGFQDGVVMVSSVLLGLRRFDVEGEVAAISFRRPAAQPASVAVRTLDGSVWRGQVLGLGDGEVFLQEAALGLCRLPIYELAEVRWGD